MRVLVHPGFHKTGTTTLQHGARENAQVLAPRLRVLLTEDIAAATRAARRYSADPDPARLAHFGACLAEVLEALEGDDGRPLLISSEDLSGHLPGRHGLASYAAAPALMGMAAEVFEALWGRGAEVTIWYTLRAPRDWERSVWWQNLKALRLTEALDDYRPRLARASALPEVVEAVTEAVTEAGRGQVRVEAQRIEEIGAAPLGPLGAALDRLGVATDGVLPVAPKNRQPDGAAEQILALNRSGLDDAALREAKKALLARLRPAR